MQLQVEWITGLRAGILCLLRRGRWPCLHWQCDLWRFTGSLLGGGVLPFVCPRAETPSSLGSQAYSESPIVSGQLPRILCSGFPLDPSLWPRGFLPSRCGTPGQSPASTHLWTSLPGPVHSRNVASASSGVRRGRSWAGGAVKMSGTCSSDHSGAPGLWSLIHPGNPRTESQVPVILGVKLWS